MPEHLHGAHDRGLSKAILAAVYRVETLSLNGCMRCTDAHGNDQGGLAVCQKGSVGALGVKYKLYIVLRLWTTFASH